MSSIRTYGFVAPMVLAADNTVIVGEARVAMTPDSAVQLKKLGHDCLIESGAGKLAGFSDQAYQAAGVSVVADAATLWAGGDVVVKVRPPSDAEAAALEKTRIRVNEFISVSELAESMKIPSTQIVQFAFKELGLMVTVNQRLDFDQIELIASQFGFEAVREDEYQAEAPVPSDDPADLQPRPPVVTIMGHVDHGKTSLLDYIRKANIVAGEAGGITQHIGAYHVEVAGGKTITFLDTPGHEAFTAMRARGAQVTDIVVLVIAADDQVMPQTVEAISHAKNAGVPMIVAINKVDLPSANVAKVKQDLLQHSVVLEDFGGNVLHAEISAKKGTGIDGLLEQVLLQAEILDLKANPDATASGAVLEATLDPGKGPLATILIQRGSLRVGEDFICGKYSGRVRALFDERGGVISRPDCPGEKQQCRRAPCAKLSAGFHNGTRFFQREDSLRCKRRIRLTSAIALGLWLVQ